MGVPRSNEGGTSQPATEGHEGAREQEDTGPTDEDKSISLQPVIEDIKPASFLGRASDCNSHKDEVSKIVSNKKLHIISGVYLMKHLTFV